MQIALNVPDNLPSAKIQQAVKEFETRLEAEAATYSDDLKVRRQRFREILEQLVELDPFADIDDPVAWQRGLRYETDE